MGDDQVSGHKRPWEPGAPPEKEVPPAEGAAPAEQAGPDCSEDIAPPGEGELAELPAEVKNAISHRGRALEALGEELGELRSAGSRE